MVVHGEFMHIPNSRDITSLAPTNWLQKKFEAVRLAASEAFSLTRDTEEQQNGGNRLPI